MNALQIAAQIKSLSFCFFQIGHHIFEPAAMLPSRIHSFYSLHYIVSGKGNYTINGISSPVEAGKVIFLRPQTELKFNSSPNQHMELYNIQFGFAPAVTANGEFHPLPNQKPVFPLFGIYTVQNIALQAGILRKMYALSKKMDALSYLHKKICMEQLFAAIVQDLQDQAAEGRSSESIREVLNYITDHFHDEISVLQLAGMSGLSAGHFTRLFRRTVGYSPKNYIVRLRMNRAKELLEFHNKNLPEIARLVGYQDEFYFSRLFKKTFGVAPSEYSKELSSDLH